MVHPRVLIDRLNQEQVLALAASALAGALWTYAWFFYLPNSPRLISSWELLVALLLAMGIVAAHKFPIHIQPHTKMYVSSVPIFLMAVLLSPPVALLGLGSGTLIGQLLVRKQRGSLPRDIATTVARWIIVGFVASSAASLPMVNPELKNLSLFAVALLLFTGDLVTFSIQLAPCLRESPWRLMRASLQESWLGEGVQYLLGIVAALATQSDMWVLPLLAVPIGVIYLLLKRSKEMHDTTQQILEMMADAVDLRDPNTGGHSKRVVDLLDNMLGELGVVGVEANLIRMAGRLHDIGKIGLPDSILNKPGQLTKDEWDIMKGHPEMGAALLSRYPDFARGADMIRLHHERWNGSGYPRGLKGTQIPLGARILAVADAFDAMTSNRPYRPAMTAQRAAQELMEGKGEDWDPAVVEAFIAGAKKHGELAPHASAPTPTYAFAPASD